MGRISAYRNIAVFSWSVLSGWFAAAWAAVDAAQRSHPPDLLGLPWMQAGVAVVITTGAGITATMNRELKAKYSNRVFHSKYEYRKDAAVSAVLGLGGYAVGLIWHADAPVVAVGLIGVGWGGTKVLGALVERVLDAIRNAKLPSEQ